MLREQPVYVEPQETVTVFMELVLTIVVYGVQWIIETGFLLLALWCLAKIQKLQYTVVGLLAAAAIACAFDLIPYVGHYIALPVLWVSLTKVTREDFTGVVFTAAISYALVFGMNLFLLGALMGDLRPSARARTMADSGEQESLMIQSDEGVDSSAEEDEDMSTPVAVQPPNVTQGAAQAAPDPAGNLPPEASLSKVFVLKGVTQNGKNSMAMVTTGAKTYTLFLGETISVETSAGKKSIRLDKVDKRSVLLEIDEQLVEVTDAPAR